MIHAVDIVTKPAQPALPQSAIQYNTEYNTLQYTTVNQLAYMCGRAQQCPVALTGSPLYECSVSCVMQNQKT